MKRVMITGASGLIGKGVLTAVLDRSDWEIHVVASGRHAHHFSNKVHAHKADLSDIRACEQLMKNVSPDIMIHLAWSLDEHDYANSDSNLIWVENSLCLLRLFFGEGGQRFIFAGSASEYGELGGRCLETRTDICRSVYGTSKKAFEMISQNYCVSHKYEFVCARIFPVYGEGDSRCFKAIPAAINAFLNGEKFICKGPNNVWDYIHIEDAANALIHIVDSGYCGIVNVGTGKPHLLRDVFTEVAKKMDCKELLVFKDNTENVTIQVADPNVLNNVIGYTCKVNFSEGLDRTISWWKSHEAIDKAE